MAPQLLRQAARERWYRFSEERIEEEEETLIAFEECHNLAHATPGLDIAWMGHYDLTVSLGIPAQFDHPIFLDAMDALVTSCRKHGVAAGFLPGTPSDMQHWLAKGFRAISLGSDVGVYSSGLTAFRKAAK